MSCPGDWPDGRLDLPARPPDPAADGPVDLAVEVDRRRPSASSGAPAASGLPVGPELDASVISDEAGRGEHGSFTGAFVGMVAFDTSGRAAPADFAELQLHAALTASRALTPPAAAGQLPRDRTAAGTAR